MSVVTHSLTDTVRVHWRAFAVAVVVGAVVAVGVRSAFVEPPGMPAMAQPGAAPAHHAEPGHAGHEHAGAPVAPMDDADRGSPGDVNHGGGGADGGVARQGMESGGADHTAHGAEQGSHVPVLLDLGNPVCPVMQGETDGETFSEWNGLRVGHCCAGCGGRFLKNPESLLDEVSPTWRDAANAAKAINAAEGTERAALIAKVAETWSVVRQPVGVAAEEPRGLLIDLGNTSCPVMGGDVNGEVFSEWNGLRVGHCCPGCTKRFLANPEALLDEVAPSWRDASAAVRRFEVAAGPARDAALAAIRNKWTVLREPAPAVSK